MNIKKNYMAIVIIVICSISLVICTDSKINDTKKEVGIIQIIEHDCLDQARNGFIDGLSELGYKDGENINIDYKNAQGDQSVCNSIANSFTNNTRKKDLILAISTPSAQAVAKLTKEIPILITAVTDPVSCGLIKTKDRPGTNITGSSDMVSVENQIKLIKKLVPKTKKIGVLYCSNEANSKLQAEMANKEAKKLNMETKNYTVSNSSELLQIMEHIGKYVDAIFVPTDNLIVSCMPLVSKIALENGIPIICSESASVKNGALATYGIDFYELGKITAKQAAKILNGESTPEHMPIEYLNEPKLVLNSKTAEKLGISIPNDLKGGTI